MPLIEGKSKSAVSGNIKLLMDEWKLTGNIGNSNPENKKKALKQAVAIALTTAGRSRNHIVAKGK